MSKPTIVMPDYGVHNADLAKSAQRLLRGNTYKDLSTIIVTPTRGGRSLIPRVVSSWNSLIKPMNQKVIGPLFIENHEVGAAYSAALDMIRANPDLSAWRYLLTLEDDNAPQPDGLMKLYEAIEGGVDGVKYDAVGGLYWTKGVDGQPMCYGKPEVLPRNFMPWLPAADTVTACNGLGMGFTLFRLSTLLDSKLPKPLFRTVQEHVPGHGSRFYTQDLAAFETLANFGCKIAVDTRVRVGHYSVEEEIMW